MFGVYRNPDLSDKIFYCLLTAMAEVQSVDGRTSFLLTGDVHVHHEERLGPSTTNLYGRATRYFASSSGCEQMGTLPSHIDVGMLDLVLTNISDSVAVWFRSPVGSPDYSAIFIVAVLEQPAPHQVCRQEVNLKQSVNWELVRREVKSLNWNGIIRPSCPVSSLNEALLRVIMDRVSKRTIVVLIGDKPWFDVRCILAHRVKQRTFRVRSISRMQADWEEYRVARCRAQLVYEEVERVFAEWSTLLMKALNLRKSWSTVKTAVFGASSSLSPVVDKGSKLVWSPDEKASLFLVYFDAKQCRDNIQQPHSCDPYLTLCSDAFRYSFIRSLFLDLYPYGGNDPDGMAPLFYRQVARELVPK